MKIQVILNPYANRWRAQQRLSQIQQALDAVCLSYDVCLTTAPWDAADLARSAVEHGYSAVIAAGGDGTVHEVVNGLLYAAGNAATIPLGIIPIGNGNDLSDMLGLPRNLSQLAAIFAEGKTRQIDAGRVNDRFFGNSCAAAMEPLVTLESSRLTRVTGNIRYLWGLIRALAKLRAWNMELEWEGGQLSGPTYLLSVCNGRRVGKLFMMAPQARFDDGLLDVVYAPRMTWASLIKFLWQLLRGKHLLHPEVLHFQTPWIRLRSDPGTPIHADGEMLGESWTNIDIRLLPGQLTVFTM